MQLNKRIASVGLVLVIVMSVSACGNMSHRGRNTAIGAGVGALSIAAAATAGKFTPTIGLNQALAGGEDVS